MLIVYAAKFLLAEIFYNYMSVRFDYSSSTPTSSKVNPILPK